MFGAFCVQQIGKKDTILPLSIGVWGINLVYLIVALIMSLFTSVDTRYFFLYEVVALTLFVVVHLFFRIAEHHVEEMSKDEEPEQKIERAKVTWR